MFLSNQKWIGKSFWALMDQVLFAFSNFFLNICLARWLAPESYGAFALAYAVFLFIGVLHTSVFTEPMLVFGSGRYASSQKPYLRSLLRLHWKRGWPVSSLLIVCLSLIYWNNPARSYILFLSVASGCMLYQWLVRRACYLSQQPALAACGGGIYLVSVLGSATLLKYFNSLTALSTIAVMAVASLLSAGIIHWLLLHISKLSSQECPSEKEILAAHWNYGRWSIATGVIIWLAGNIPMVSLPWWHGNLSAGTFRAGLNLILPIQQLLVAAGPLLLPVLVRKRSDSQFIRITFGLGLALMIPPFLWTVLLFAAGPRLAQWLYPDNYNFDRSFLLLLGLAATFTAFGHVVSSSLRALERPGLAFRGYAASALASLIVGLPIIANHGIAGAAGTLAISTFVSAAVLSWVLVKHLKSPDTQLS